MPKPFLSVFVVIVCQGITCSSVAQSLFFRHIGSEQGMNSLLSHYCAVDHYGFIWVGSGDGLVRYNGKEVTYFSKQSHPELPQDEIASVFCDSRNHIWVMTRRGAVRINEKRQFQRLLITESDPDVATNSCFEDAAGRIYINTAIGVYSLGMNDTRWINESWLDSLISGHHVIAFKKFDKNRLLIVASSYGIILVNLSDKKKEVFFSIKNLNNATRYDDNSIIISTGNSFQLSRVYLSEPGSLHAIAPPPFFHKDNRHERIHNLVRAADGNIYMTTSNSGLLRLDSAFKNYTQFLHDPLDRLTISSDAPKYITADSIGNLLFTSLDGVNYTNVHNASVDYINYFKTDDGELIHTRVSGIAEDKHHNLWISTRDNLFIHNRKNNSTYRVKIPTTAGLKSDKISPFYIERDRNDKMWVGLTGEGIAIFDGNGVFQRLIRANNYPGYNKSFSQVRIIREGNDGYVYIGTETGLLRISHEGYALDTFAGHEAILPVTNSRIVDILPVQGGLWVSSSPGGAAYFYSFTERKLKKYSTENGLVANRVYGLTADLMGNIYSGTYAGLSVIDQEGAITNFQKGQGLLSGRVESIESADDGSIWMTNHYNLLKYDPQAREFFRVGGRHGLLDVNYVIMASVKLSSGEIAFGANKGLLIVNPAKIDFKTEPLKVFVFYYDADGYEREFINGERTKFSYKQQNIQFTFAVNDMIIADQVLFRYRLSSTEGAKWSEPSLSSRVDFSLRPGRFSLEVEAYDGQNWFALPEPVRFKIGAPWWEQWWFFTLVFLLAVLAILGYFRARISKYRKELTVARQITDLESKALRAQMNPHFVFNSLNAIQECIVTGKVDQAYIYLSKFSRLLRMVLEHSDAAEITLMEELEVLSLYVSLEKLRFKDDMNFHQHIDDDLDTEEIRIAPMLIQPHLENAIWHGLRHKDGHKNLQLSIAEIHPGYLEVVIEDNGIGRKRAESLRKNRLGENHHKSKGSQLSANRMAVFHTNFPLSSIVIHDLYDSSNEPAGTKVIISIPILNNKAAIKRMKA